MSRCPYLCAFGSRVKGNASWESDLDVYIIIKDLTTDSSKQIIDIAWEVGFQRDVIISPLIFSQEQFESGPLSESSIVKTILREGVAA
ncbi:MAG: nucleotidyltransferase domain-containing protein [Candidatus Atribacteria bacterium]|nr:nucleotidyltransferase domain-containing protein [Candidatus Atribacteria bacterium]